MTNIFGVPVDAVYHLVSGLTGFLTPVLGGLAAVAAIILLTVAVRAVLVPLSFRAMRGQAVQSRLAPELQALRTRYAKQPERLQKEMTALYKREGTSLFAGITPLLLQWPLLSVVYVLFRSAQVAGKPNILLSHDLFGVPLGMHWLSGAGAASLQGLVFLGVFTALAALTWLTARLGRQMAAAQAAAAPAPAPAPAKGAGSAKRAAGQLTSGRAGASGKRASGQLTAGGSGGSGKRASAQLTAGGSGGSGKRAAGQLTSARAGGSDQSTGSAGSAGTVPAGTPGWLVRVLPYLTVAFAAFVPLAAGVYLITSVAWSLGERTFFWRFHSRANRAAVTS